MERRSRIPANSRWVCLLALLALVLVGCRRRSVGAVRSRGPARLVVAVVLDQVGSWVLDRYLPRLRPDGALRRAIARGAFHRRVTYAYAGTYTAPGHAAIYTGRAPEGSGVGMNRGLLRGRRSTESIVEDHAHPVFGARGETASPALLQCETVADALLRQTGGRARVVSVSMKDRGAVIPGGARPTMALWYDEHARRFTTSTYYANATPAWLDRFHVEHPVSAQLQTWNPLDPAALSAHSEPDDAPGEGDWKGLGTVFPHELSRASDPYAALLATPMSSEWLLALAGRAAAEYQLGRDEVPDLLAISVSGTDYVGHVFGAESREAEDNLVRVDLALGRLIARLEREGRGPVALLVTADHGVARLPESSAREGLAAHRLDWDELPERVNALLDRTVGREALSSHDGGVERDASAEATVRADAGADAGGPPRVWAEAFVQPYLFLTPEARAPAVRERAVSAAIAALRTIPGVFAAYDVRDAERLRASSDPIERAVGMSIPRRATYELGDVFVVPAERSLVDERLPRGHGTSHGSPWAYDTEVPVIFSGPGVEHVETREALPQDRVAATIAALLRVRPPEGAPTETLPGVR